MLRACAKVLGAWLARRTPLAIYQCATTEQVGIGGLRHSWGNEVADSATKGGKAWEYDAQPLDRHGERVTGEHTIFGPYVNDFGKPGFYRVRYRICGKGFQNTDEPILSLDVVQARFGTDQTLRLLGQRIVRAKEFSGKYQNFDIVCHVPGTGVYEYRCAVLPKGVILSDRSIRFDQISVYSHPQIWEAL